MITLSPAFSYFPEKLLKQFFKFPKSCCDARTGELFIIPKWKEQPLRTFFSTLSCTAKETRIFNIRLGSICLSQFGVNRISHVQTFGSFVEFAITYPVHFFVEDRRNKFLKFKLGLRLNINIICVLNMHQLTWNQSPELYKLGMFWTNEGHRIWNILCVHFGVMRDTEMNGHL